MTSYLQGETASLVVEWFEHAGGPAQDVTDQTITVTRISDSTVIVGPTGVGIAHLATGVYRYNWAISSTETPGDYLVVWNATDAQSEAVQATETVSVLGINAGTWATTAQVLALTGQTVSAQTVAEASAVIDIYANRSFSASASMSARDLGWLQRATAFQAAWMPLQPGYHQRNSYEQITTDGTQVIYGKEWQISLAPMAARALKNLSWKTNRTVELVNMRTPEGYRGDFADEASDPYTSWESFSIGNPPHAGGC